MRLRPKASPGQGFQRLGTYVHKSQFNDADEALSVGRNNLVRRELSELRREYEDDGIIIADCARRIVRIVAAFGLQTIHTSPIPKPVNEDDLGVVCYQVVIPKTL